MELPFQQYSTVPGGAHQKSKGVPNHGKMMPATRMPFTIKTIAVAAVGAAAVGSYMTGAGFVNVLTSLNGAAGSAIGVASGDYLARVYPDSQLAQNASIILSVGIPAMAGGQLDSVVIGMGVGAWGAQKLVSDY